MTDVLEAKTPAGTYTIRRRRDNTETPKQVVDPKQPGQPKFSTGDVLPSQAHILRFVSGDKEHSIAPSLVSSQQDQADAVFEAPGTHLSARLRHVLPVLALIAPGEQFLPPEVLERLLSCDALIAPQRVRSPASAQVELSADRWMAQVRAWASSYPQRHRVVDDSRESIYGIRG